MQFIAHDNVPYTNNNGCKHRRPNPQPHVSRQNLHRAARPTLKTHLRNLKRGIAHVWYVMNHNRPIIALAELLNVIDCIVFNFKDWCADKTFRKGFSVVSVVIYAFGILSGFFLCGRLNGLL